MTHVSTTAPSPVSGGEGRSRHRPRDRRSFEDLVRRHGGRLLQVARRYLPEEDARDAVQDGLLSAFRSLDGFDGRADMATWLHRVVINASLKILRKQRPEAKDSIDDLLPSFGPDGYRLDVGSPWQDSAHDLLEREETRQAVLRCIDLLPQRYRTVILLRDIEELDTAETAQLLEITVAAVKVRLHRARMALRELIDRCLRPDSPGDPLT